MYLLHAQIHYLPSDRTVLQHWQEQYKQHVLVSLDLIEYFTLLSSTPSSFRRTPVSISISCGEWRRTIAVADSAISTGQALIST